MAVSLVRGKGKRLNEKKKNPRGGRSSAHLPGRTEREKNKIRQVMEEKKEGRPEDRGMQDGKRERR